MSAADALVRCREVSRSFGSGSAARAVIDGLELSIRAGQRIAVMSPSGSGKSTLIHLLAGFERPDTGRIEWDPAVPPARRAAVIFQTPSLIPTLSAVENVELPLLADVTHPLPARRTAHQAASEALADLDLSAVADRLPDELSGGQAQRVAIARALVAQPRLLLADEPTGQLDRSTADHVIEVLLTAARLAGAALLVATHDRRVADRFDDLFTIRHGRLAAESRSSA